MRLGVLLLVAPTLGWADSLVSPGGHWPTWDDVYRVVSLRDHNTRVVVAGTTLFGLAAGLVGSFLLLRRRALMGDVLSHAMLPGIALAFLIGGKALPVLLAGGALTGMLGVACVLLIRRWTRLKEDAAMGIVLSVFFGAGVALLGVIQQIPSGHAAGLESFVYGKTAAMLTADARRILLVGALTSAACLLLFKELALLCFDEAFAATSGLPTTRLDVLLMVLVVAVTVVGLQAVGLILVIAMLIIPAAAARFWTDHLPRMALSGALIGGASGLLGSMASALWRDLPAGAVIVLLAATIFGVSMLVGPARGVFPRWLAQRSLRRRIAHQHLMRALWEAGELAADGPSADGPSADGPSADGPPADGVSLEALLAVRSWSAGELRLAVRRAVAAGHLRPSSAGGWALTASGRIEAARLVRNHRLWELYLITHADIAPSHVDRDADAVEHVLGAELLDQLEDVLRARGELPGEIDSPHALQPAGGGPA